MYFVALLIVIFTVVNLHKVAYEMAFGYRFVTLGHNRSAQCTASLPNPFLTIL